MATPVVPLRHLESKYEVEAINSWPYIGGSDFTCAIWSNVTFIFITCKEEETVLKEFEESYRNAKIGPLLVVLLFLVFLTFVIDY